MQLEHSFTVPVSVEEAWRILLDIERIGPCMPGAVIDSVDGDDFTGTVKVKLGPINLTYKGKASFVEKDEAAHRAVIDARGRDARGNGTAAAKVTASLADAGGTTTVHVTTDLDITGKPAQFGRGVMVDVGNKLIGQFADCLATTIGSGEFAGAAGARAEAGRRARATAPSGRPAPTKRAARPKPKPVDEATEPPAHAPAAEGSAVVQSVGDEAGPADAPPAPEDAALQATAQAPSYSAPVVVHTDAASDEQPAAPEPPAQVPAEEGSAVAEFDDEAARSYAVHGGLPAPELDEEPSVNGRANRPAPRPASDVEPIDLLQSAGPAVAKRLAPVAVALVVVLLGIRRRRARRS